MYINIYIYFLKPSTKEKKKSRLKQATAAAKRREAAMLPRAADDFLSVMFVRIILILDL